MFASLFVLKRPDVPLRVALRNTAGLIMPLAVGAATGHLEVGLAVSTGALNTMMSDQPGAYRTRIRRMLLTAFAAAAAAFVGFSIGGHDALTVAVVLVWAFGAGLLVAVGPDAARAGLASMILLVLTSAEPRAPLDAIGPALLIFSGGVLQLLLAIAAWPLQRYHPERVALAEVYRQLARAARHRDDAGDTVPTTEALLDVQTLLHGRDRARGIAVDAFRVLAEASERIRVEILAITELQARADAATRQPIRSVLDAAARVLDDIALSLDEAVPPTRAATAIAALDAPMAALDDTDPGITDRRGRALLRIACARVNGLASQLRTAVRNTDAAGSRGELRAAAVEARLPPALRPRDPLATLRANLNFSSVAFRHALRCAIGLAVAVAVERALQLPHGYWIPMTLAIVLRPDFAGTLRFGLLRVAGTLVGLALATATVHFVLGGEWERIALLAALCFGYRILTSVHYAFGVTMLTGMVVVLLSFIGISPGETMPARAVGTVVGSALALIGYTLWPTWEAARMWPRLADLLDAYRHYFIAVLAQTPCGDERSAARSARTNAQAALERWHGEPNKEREQHDLAEKIFVSANRFVRAAMALEAVLQNTQTLPARTELLAFAQRSDAAMASLAQTLRDAGAVSISATLRDQQRALADALDQASDSDEQRDTAAAVIDASDRITDTINTLAHLLRQRVV